MAFTPMQVTSKRLRRRRRPVEAFAGGESGCVEVNVGSR
jgi:hypothetical protein